jgi:hypothetical protein
MAAPSNAFLEARQALEFEQSQETFRQSQIRNVLAIINDPNVDDATKTAYEAELARLLSPTGELEPQQQTLQTIKVPVIDFTKEVLGAIGITDKGKTSLIELGASLKTVAASGTQNYFGLTPDDLYYQSAIFSKLPTELTRNARSASIDLNVLFDNDLVTALRGYERATGQTILVRGSQGQSVISKADAKKVLDYYYKIHRTIATSQK